MRNRVTATGEIISDPSRGLFMGNRGILHDENGHVGRALWKHKSWITCALHWKDRHREVMKPGAYTELFFLDEIVALAAGHRPCAECRREAYNRYREAVHHGGSAPDLDRQLHAERAVPRTFGQRRHVARLSSLPDGAMVLTDRPSMVQKGRLRPVTPSGYLAPVPFPKVTEVIVLTPETSVKALENGYLVDIHPSALA